MAERPYVSLMDVAAENQSHVAVCSLPPLGQDLDSPANDAVRDHNAIIRRVADDTGATYLPVHERMAAVIGKTAPRVDAKGSGEIGRKIIETAEQHGVPIEKNAGLAAALAGVELEQEIPVELYKAVAEVLGFVLRINRERP